MADLIKVGVELSPELYKQVKQRAIDLDLRLKDCVSQAFAQWLEKGGVRPANGLSTSHLKPYGAGRGTAIHTRRPSKDRSRDPHHRRKHQVPAADLRSPIETDRGVVPLSITV
jgi:hypothetical protein